MSANINRIVTELRQRANPVNAAGMARFGIVGRQVLGVSMGPLRVMARRIGRDHELAEALRASDIFEARILAGFVADPKRLTRRQAEAWANKFECWADCDGLCIHLLRKTAFAHALAVAWSGRRRELVKRAGFTMMATLAVHDKSVGNDVFRDYLRRVEAAALDDRHNVKKGVNWALRQIGKRSPILNREALRTARRLQKLDSKAARWIASDALRELQRWKLR